MPENKDQAPEAPKEGDAPVEAPQEDVTESEAPAEEVGVPADLDNLNMEPHEPKKDDTRTTVTSICNHMVRLKDGVGKEYQLAPKQSKEVMGVSEGMKKLVEKEMIKLS